MKKIKFALAGIVGSLFLFAACQDIQENNIDFVQPGDDEIAFSSSRVATRSEAQENEVVTTTIALGEEAEGLGLILEETVTKLDNTYGSELMTRSTPAYTENVGDIYKKFDAYVTKVTDRKESKAFDEKPFLYDQNQKLWSRRFYQDPWKDVGENPLYFYMKMPVEMTNAEGGVSNLTYALDANNKQTISFDYISPTDATKQADILFAARSLTKEQYETAINKKTYPDVLFHHALTAVKFANYFPNVDGNTKTIITGITFEGLIDSGHCLVTPREETNGYVDDETGDYSSGDKTTTEGITTGTVVWSDGTRSKKLITASIDEEFAEYNTQKLPEAFTSKNAEQNLNDATATKTFMIIPQLLDENVKVKVDFKLVYVEKDGKKPEDKVCHLTLNLGKLLKEKSLEWKAGELRTYTLKPNIVDVDITDKMDTYKYTKSNVVIKNLGNVPQYVRVYMIGNWVGDRQIGDGKYNGYDTILMGYTSDEMENGKYKTNDEVARWNDKDFTLNGETKVYPKWSSPLKEYDYTPYGEFVGLPPMGTKQAGGTEVNNWIRHDKFYYYTDPIGPGAEVPDTDPLFTSYTIGESPKFYIADPSGVRRLARNVHFVMDLAVQAIECPMKADGTGPEKTYLQAWTEALNPNNVDPDFNINDL